MNRSSFRAVSIGIASIALLLLILALSCTDENGISSAFLKQRKEHAAYVTDARDGKKYRTVKIGNLNWLAENVNFQTADSWCYGGISANCSRYGRLYAWGAAATSACPAGWHLPTAAEWGDLRSAVGNDARLFAAKSWGGLDRQGWSALPGGMGDGGEFWGEGMYARYWSAAEEGADRAQYWNITGDVEHKEYGMYSEPAFKGNGASVRCVEDAPGASRQFYVSFDANGGADVIFPLGAADGQSLGSRFPESPTRQGGYRFEGWFDAAGNPYTSATAIRGNAALTARWRAVPVYTVTFNTSGGTPAYVGPVSVDSGLAMGARMPANITKADSAFAGWFDGVAQYTANTPVNNDVALTARWKEWPRFTVAFDVNGGTPDVIAPITIDSGKAIGAMMPANPENADSIFVGWYDGDIKYDDKTIITKTVTLTAKWVSAIQDMQDVRDGKKYKTVVIGNQTWMGENLNYQTSSGSYCYSNNTSNCAKYGRLYDWKTAMAGSASSSKNPSGVRGICPSGWHLPSEAEWSALVTAAGGATAGKNLKSKTGWNSSGNGSDVYGFSALPGGGYHGGSFTNAGNYGNWWKATEYDSNYAYIQYMGYSYDYVSWGYNYKSDGFSVRCVKD
jgi:uncharacterized protein (TIGR02145 family)